MKHRLSSFITQEEPKMNLGGGDKSADSVDSNIEMAMESDLATRGATLTQSELINSVVAILTKILDEPDLDLREDLLQSYDPNKKNNNILESSSNAVHNNYAHLKEVKMLAELLLQNVKEKSCVR